MDNKSLADSNYTVTENGAKTLKNTGSAVLDFFAQGLSSRISNTPTDAVLDMFYRAFNEDETLALRCLYYGRDPRFGQGERKLFRSILNSLGNKSPSAVLKNISYIPYFGRWDDLFALVGTECEQDAFEFMADQLKVDIASKGGVSLLAKWLPSENTHSDQTRTLARMFRRFLNISPKDYRQTLSILRKKIRIVERNMCSKTWQDIDYATVPSRASMIYRKAFKKHDSERYTKYLGDVASGKTEIKAGTLYPYDIMRSVAAEGHNETLELQWKALPDYLKDSPHNGIVVADVSGSMCTICNPRPIDVCLSLAIYFAERNQGIFKDKFITFSSQPQIQSLAGANLYEKMMHLNKSKWNMNTDIQAVFNVILETAVKDKTPLQHMPSKIYIISDMQFDRCTNNKSTNYEAIEEKYKQAGYLMPALVFWNVAAKIGNGSPVNMDDKGTYLVSGCSPSILSYALTGKAVTPYDLMLETLNNERYAVIKA